MKEIGSIEGRATGGPVRIQASNAAYSTELREIRRIIGIEFFPRLRRLQGEDPPRTWEGITHSAYPYDIIKLSDSAGLSKDLFQRRYGIGRATHAVYEGSVYSECGLGTTFAS